MSESFQWIKKKAAASGNPFCVNVMILKLFFFLLMWSDISVLWTFCGYDLEAESLSAPPLINQQFYSETGK